MNFETLTHSPSALVKSGYKVISSREVIDFIESKGFRLVETKVTKPRKMERRGHQKHFLIFENDQLNNISGLKYQLLVTNSYDGSTSFKIDFGIFRMICANGLVVGNVFDRIRQIHTGTFNLAEKIDQFILSIPKVSEVVRNMNEIKINDGIKHLITKKVYELRDLKGRDSIFTPKRIEDDNNDLFSYYNVAQEYMIRGGFLHVNDKQHIVNARKLQLTSESIKMNKELFNFVNEFSL